MKNYLQIIGAIVLLTLVLSNCKEPTPPPTPTRPKVRTDTVPESLSQTWAIISGWVQAGYLPTTVSFEYDTDLKQEVFRYKTPADIDTISGNTEFLRMAYLSNLTPNTTYYYYIKAENALGVAVGITKEFTTLDVDTSKFAFNPDLVYGEISDIEDNIYKTIQIGDQIWMAQNLAVTKYNDGEEINLVTDYKWQYTDTSGIDAYSWYNGIETKYGALYNWYAVNTDKLCPDGWRVPTEDDWTTLINHLGGAVVAGGKLKEAALKDCPTHWTLPNVGATNSSGFTAVPGGYRNYLGNYSNSIKRYGYWWSSTSKNSSNAVGYSLFHGYTEINILDRLDKRTGASVRCIKEYH